MARFPPPPHSIPLKPCRPSCDNSPRNHCKLARSLPFRQLLRSFSHSPHKYRRRLRTARHGTMNRIIANWPRFDIFQHSPSSIENALPPHVCRQLQGNASWRYASRLRGSGCMPQCRATYLSGVSFGQPSLYGSFVVLL